MTAAVVALLLAQSSLAAPAPKTGRKAATPKPRTLVTVPGSIVAVAQDGNLLAWASTEPGTACPSRVRARNVLTGAQSALTRVDGETCIDPAGFAVAVRVELAVAGRRVAWTTSTPGDETVERVRTATLEGEESEVDRLVANGTTLAGLHLGGLAGSGSTLVYGRYEQSVVGGPDCEAEGTCRRITLSGSTRRIARGASADIGATGPTGLVATGDGLVASVSPEAAGIADAATSQPGTVEVWQAALGALACSFTPPGVVHAVAVGRHRVALLVESAGKRYLELRETTSCRTSTIVQVDRSAADELSLSGPLVLLRVGSTLRVHDARDGRRHLVATRSREPIGATIEGRRVVWGENADGRGRLLVLTLPSRLS